MNFTEDTIMNDANNVITPPTSMRGSRRFNRCQYREQMAQQPRSVSLRDFGSCSYDKDNTPSTPPSTMRKTHQMCLTQPPEVPRHGRPINRRLLLSEAQERLSLPDLFAPRTPSQLGRRRVKALPQRPSLVPIQPRPGMWGDCCDEPHSHSMSTRSIFSNMNPAEF